jgi:hypothetical protein
MPTPLISHEASRRPQNKRTQPQSPNRPAKATNHQINQFFSAKKPNQSTLPGRSTLVEHLSPTQDPSSRNYYSSLDTGVEEEKEELNKGQETQVFYNTLDTGCLLVNLAYVQQNIRAA